ncbi:MAG TPA: hypothetical protein VHJ78_12835 [Actinomycetota bacterium]|nr:hypothetical protein [Actinomycetota bacterium]
MSRAFFDQIDDEVRGMVGPALRQFNSERTGRLIKIWYANPAVHFEVQRLSGKWAPSSKPCLEIGLHLESKDSERNAEMLHRLLEARPTWGPQLEGAEPGEAFGPMGARWRRVSEVVDLEGMDEDFAGEVAERFARYIRSLYPLIS